MKPVEEGREGFLVAAVVRVLGAAAGLVVVVEALVVVVFSAVGLVVLDAPAVVVVLVLDLAEVLETGVFGSAGDLLDFDSVEVLLVEIGAGLEDLVAAALSLVLAEGAVFSLPVVTPFRSSPTPEAPFRPLPPETAAALLVSAGRSFALRSSAEVGLSGFPAGFVTSGKGSFGSMVGVPCLLAALDWISRANSGIVSETSMLFLRALNSAWIDFFRSMTTSGSVASFSTKLPRRCDMVESSGGTLVVSFLKPHCMPDCPFRSTATKLVRTFDSGRGDALLLPA
jgi:hypothetical protein